MIDIEVLEILVRKALDRQGVHLCNVHISVVLSPNQSLPDNSPRNTFEVKQFETGDFSKISCSIREPGMDTLLIYMDVSDDLIADQGQATVASLCAFKYFEQARLRWEYADLEFKIEDGKVIANWKGISDRLRVSNELVAEWRENPGEYVQHVPEGFQVAGIRLRYVGDYDERTQIFERVR